MQENAVSLATRDVAAATREAAAVMQQVASAVDGLLPPDVSGGHRVYPRNAFAGVPGLGHAMRLCRTQDPETGEWVGLASLMRRVPEEYVATACTVGRGPETLIVSCPCGETVFTAAELTECGGCSRWYISDESGPWAIRLPAQEASDA
jgi:hypothetical protein